MAQKLRAVDADAGLIRSTFAQFPSGVAVLAVERDGARHALVASSFMVGVSLQPCLVAVAVQRTSETWEHLAGSPALGVSIFGRGQGALTRKLASSDRAARFEQVAVEVDDSGAVYVEDAALWLQCSVHDVLDAGDHRMVLLRVDKAGVSGNEPLIWHGARFRELVADDSIDVA
ncbi:flavin reductase family protein [Blastococcus sp. SYSU D00820]